jgi:hypothetical protein
LIIEEYYGISGATTFDKIGGTTTTGDEIAGATVF